MQYGLCTLSVVPLRSAPDSKSEMTSQVLYGEHFTVTEQLKDWSKICIAFDSYTGWISSKQFLPIPEKEYYSLNVNPLKLSGDLVEFISDAQHHLIPILLGSHVSSCSLLSHRFEGILKTGKNNRSALIETAFLYLNAPYLWGGKTPFGIDCSGFTQMVYKINGYMLLRDAAQQATQGEVLSFLEESSPGDLAFFDNEEGTIIHVGMVLDNNSIIHAHGKVRIDKIDHTGIFNVDTKTYSHKLRVIKKII
jgi:gamma-D-glutamyl-L-lysine dipeptidyl-peptidase